MRSKEVIRMLGQDGWEHCHTKGSHSHFVHSDKTGRVTVPHPTKDIPVGTLRNIYRQAGWDWNDR